VSYERIVAILVENRFYFFVNESGGLTNRNYRVSIKCFLDYKHLLQENYVEYKHIFYVF
jgi:hypothetical protein